MQRGKAQSPSFSFLISSVPCCFQTHKFERLTEGDVRPALLEGSLKHVPKLGWSLSAISAGARDMNLPGISHGLFPKGTCFTFLLICAKLKQTSRGI
jgi:hypothetical protein